MLVVGCGERVLLGSGSAGSAVAKPADGGQADGGQADGGTEGPAGSWTVTGALVSGRYRHTATLLASGKVLLAGGLTASQVTATAEWYDPADGTFSQAPGLMATGRSEHTATLLSAGSVLLAGGYGAPDEPLTSAELYDAATGTFAGAGSMALPRAQHTATLLPSGKVLLAGGTGDASVIWAGTEAELYDQASGAFSMSQGLGSARYRHTATLLPSGNVLVAGGYGTHYPAPGWGPQQTTEVYKAAVDVFTGEAVWARDLGTARYAHTATLLSSGAVLLVGGTDDHDALTSAELYTSGVWGTMPETGPLSFGRYDHTATLLSSGKVLVVGGRDATGSALATAELYDPVTGSFEPARGALASARFGHTATLLLSGKVLIAGGASSAGATGSAIPLSSAELYDPATGTFRPAAPP